jgi:hypothetical protein
MNFETKKYLLNFSFLVILIACFAFLLDSPFDQKSLAQLPIFEIYPEGGHSYPLLENPLVQLAGTTVSVTAKITDPSGVYGAVLTIEDENENQVPGSVLMYSSGNDIYIKTFSVESFDNDKTYYVSLFVRDGLGYSHTYENIGSFTLGLSSDPDCDTSGEAELCIITSLQTPTATIPITTDPCKTSGSATLCISGAFSLLP